MREEAAGMDGPHRTPTARTQGIALILFVVLNLLVSNVLTDYLPADATRFAVGMWSPAFLAILFCLFLRLPLKPTLGLGRATAPAWLLAVVFPVLAGLVTVVLGWITGRLTSSGAPLPAWSNALPTLVIWTAASLGEELGWRGYLHSGLQGMRHAPLAIGLVWAVWHYREVMADGGPAYALLVFTPAVVLISYFLSTLRELGGSIWPCALFHGVWNFLRMKVLFGNPAQGTTGLFSTGDSRLTDMEGLFGLAALALLSVPVLIGWYRRVRPAPGAAAE